MYNPTYGVWITRDPLPQATLHYADGVNLYEYVGDNPSGRVDPTGTKIVVSGDDKEFKASVLEKLKKLKEMGGKIATLITDIEKSENTLTIKEAKDFVLPADPKTGQKEIRIPAATITDAGSSKDPEVVKRWQTTGVDVTIELAMTGEPTCNDSDLAKKDAKQAQDMGYLLVMLTHEMTHARDFMAGRIPIDPKTGKVKAHEKKGPSGEDIPVIEDEAVRMENIVRKALGFPIRSKYEGIPIDDYDLYIRILTTQPSTQPVTQPVTQPAGTLPA